MPLLLASQYWIIRECFQGIGHRTPQTSWFGRRFQIMCPQTNTVLCISLYGTLHTWREVSVPQQSDAKISKTKRATRIGTFWYQKSIILPTLYEKKNSKNGIFDPVFKPFLSKKWIFRLIFVPIYKMGQIFYFVTPPWWGFHICLLASGQISFFC